MVKSGTLVKIVPSATARSKSLETTVSEKRSATEDKFVTEVIRLNYLSPDDGKDLLTPLLSENGLIVSYPPTGALIITDSQSNIRRLQRIIKVLDVPRSQEQIEVVGE